MARRVFPGWWSFLPVRLRRCPDLPFWPIDHLCLVRCFICPHTQDYVSPPLHFSTVPPYILYLDETWLSQMGLCWLIGWLQVFRDCHQLSALSSVVDGGYCGAGHDVSRGLQRTGNPCASQRYRHRCQRQPNSSANQCRRPTGWTWRHVHQWGWLEPCRLSIAWHAVPRLGMPYCWWGQYNIHCTCMFCDKPFIQYIRLSFRYSHWRSSCPSSIWSVWHWPSRNSKDLVMKRAKDSATSISLSMPSVTDHHQLSPLTLHSTSPVQQVQHEMTEHWIFTKIPPALQLCFYRPYVSVLYIYIYIHTYIHVAIPTTNVIISIETAVLSLHPISFSLSTNQALQLEKITLYSVYCTYV